MGVIEWGRAWRAALVLLVVLVSASCAGHVPPNAAAETRVAIYGDDVMKGVAEIQAITLNLEKAGIANEGQIAWVMNVTWRMGKAGQALSVALDAYHTATDLIKKRLALADAQAALDRIETEVKRVLQPFDGTGVKARYAAVFLGLIEAVYTLRFQLPSAAVPPAGPSEALAVSEWWRFEAATGGW